MQIQWNKIKTIVLKTVYINKYKNHIHAFNNDIYGYKINKLKFHNNHLKNNNLNKNTQKNLYIIKTHTTT